MGSRVVPQLPSWASEGSAFTCVGILVFCERLCLQKGFCCYSLKPFGQNDISDLSLKFCDFAC